MKSIIPAFALLILATGIMTCKPNQTSDHKDKPSNQESYSNPTHSNKHPHDSQDTQTNSSYDSWDWRTAVKRPEWWLVIAAFLTIGVIGWQAIETRHATEAMERSVTVQQTAMQQWIEIGEWETTKEGLHGVEQLVVKLTIRNPTNFPIIIRTGHMFFGYFHNPRIADWNLMAPDRLLPAFPKTIQINLPMFSKQLQELENNDLVVSIEGEFRHSDNGPNGDTVFPVRGRLLCGGTAIFEADSMPTRKTTVHENQY